MCIATRIDKFWTARSVLISVILESFGEGILFILTTEILEMHQFFLTTMDLFYLDG